jgi:hypothetical protein
MTERGPMGCEEVRDLAPLFATGSLEPAEMDAVRAHLATCAEPHEELLQLGEAATALLDAVPPAEPPARLRSSLLAAAAADLEAGTHPAAPRPAAPAPVVDLAEARARRRSRIGWLLAAAAVVVALVLGGSNLALRRDLDAAQAYRDGVTQALDLAAQPGAATALLRSEDGSVSGFGVVASDGSVRIALKGLAPTTGSEVYTAWAITGDAPPVAVGEFTVGPNGVATASGISPTTGPGAVLALTLEPAPGATAPSSPVVAAGTTRAG